MYLLENPTRSYAWGSRTVIADLLGQPVSGDRQAELWIGAHPDRPSRLVDAGHDLLAQVTNDPRGTLGTRTYEEFDGTLPYLMKVLAVDRPLSLQVHPDRDQAITGFAADEQVRGSERTFKDRRHKAELAYAVSDFSALSGFRERRECRDVFGMLARRNPRVRAFGEIENLLHAPDDENALRSVCRYIAGLDSANVAEMIEGLSGADYPDSSLAVAKGLAAAHPGDAAVLLTLLLRYVELRPGEAIGVDPRTPHTYLRGTIIELTTCSDNTIRAGLTSKPTDIGRFIDVLEYAPGGGATLSPCEASGAERTYTSGYDEFELSVVQLAPGESIRWPPKPRTMLVLDGKVSATDATGSTWLGRGDSVFVPADCGDLEIRGDGVAVQATTGV